MPTHGRARRTRGHDGERGQSTLEYLLVALALIAVVVALGALVRYAASGLLVYRASDSASHAVGTSRPGEALLDIFMY